MRITAAAFLLAATAASAHADSKSWASVKNMLPDSVNVIVGANVAALRGTSLYASVMPTLLAKQPDLKTAIETAKATCSLDLDKAIVDATFAMNDDERGILVVAFDKSVDQKKTTDCLQKVVAAQNAPKAELAKDKKAPKAEKVDLTSGKAELKPEKADPKAEKSDVKLAAKLVVKTTGKITEYGLEGDTKHVYVAWLANDVAAFATDFDDKALLEKMIAGKGTKGAINGLLQKSGQASTVWLAATKAQPVPTGGTMKGAFGKIDATKGNVSMDISAVLSSAQEAKQLVDQSTALIASAKANVPQQFVKLVDALKLTAAQDTANVKLVATEKDLLPVLAMAMMNL